MEPIRVLQIVPAMNCGGMETFIMNVYRSIDRSKVQFDFLCHYKTPGFYDDEITALGGKIYRLSVREDNNFPKYFRELDQFFGNHPEYRIVHGHFSGFGMFYNHYAKKHGIRIRIGHSHSDKYETGLIGQLDRYMSKPFRYGLTQRFACSEAAGKFLFGSKPFSVFYNGIDQNRFLFSQALRQKLRSQYSIAPEDRVIGHVGRFAPVKNQPFLIQAFEALHRDNPHWKLVLVGGGDPALIQNSKNLVKELGIEDGVIFAGLQKNVCDYYHMFDLFVLPSLFEGIPLCLIEAQTNGLPCVVSDAVNRSADVTGNVEFAALDREQWVGAMERAGKMGRLPREACADKIAKSGYDIGTTAGKLQAYYLAAYQEDQKQVK